MSEGVRADHGRRGHAPAGPGSWDDRTTDHIAEVEALLYVRLGTLQQRWHSDIDPAAEATLPDALDPVARVRDLIRCGGKRMRPVMVLLGWIATDTEGTHRGRDDMVRASAALELLHCFALVHDDVMDESPTRRGHPTVHEAARRWHAGQHAAGDSARFGDNMAVLVGDLAHAEAEQLAGDLPESMRRVWQRMVRELVAGQLHDIAGSASPARPVDVARRIARQKTGLYTSARPLQLGASAMGAGAEALTALEFYGRNVGEAFALRDDLLGVYGDPDETGKPVGDDIRSGKPTVLMTMAHAALRGRAAAALQAAGSPDMTDTQVSLVRDAMLHEGVVTSVEVMIGQRVADAVAAVRHGARVGALSVDGVGRLTRVADQFAHRKK